MHYFFITGTSAGLGKALAEGLLQNPQVYVVGLSRSEIAYTHPRYRHVVADLSQSEQIDRVSPLFLALPPEASPLSLTLINNAGILGEIGHFANSSDWAQVMSVNLLASMQLSQHFTKVYAAFDCRKTILHISSGAAKRPIDGWAAYCASKAGLEMFTQVFEAEQQTATNPIRMIAYSPGVIDTDMQAQIRAANPAEFSQQQRFIDLKKQNELPSAQTVAQKLIAFLGF
jgi:benzil reductase ((S)-benzoin forming)